MRNREGIARQVWHVLVLTAQKQLLISYSSLGRMVGVPAKALAPILERVENYCKRSNLPNISAVVVNQDDGIPGHLFPAYSNKSAKARNTQLNDRAAFASRQQSRVFVFDWPTTEPPDDAFKFK
jgi:hypothetical protein